MDPELATCIFLVSESEFWQARRCCSPPRPSSWLPGASDTRGWCPASSGKPLCTCCSGLGVETESATGKNLLNGNQAVEWAEGEACMVSEKVVVEWLFHPRRECRLADSNHQRL